MSVILHPDIQRQLVGGKDLLDDIDRVTAYLAELMQEVHGGPWKFSVNHQNCFAIVSRDFSADNPVDKSNSGSNPA